MSKLGVVEDTLFVPMLGRIFLQYRKTALPDLRWNGGYQP